MTLRPEDNEQDPWMDERKLAGLAAQGDQGAKREIAEALYDRVRSTIGYISTSDRDRDDWVQLAMLEILSSLGSYRGISSLNAWADRIAIRTAMRYLKRRRRHEEKVAPVAEIRPSTAQITDDLQERLMVRRRISAILGNIDHKCRIAVVMKLVHGYSVEEISSMTDTPKDTVKGRLKRGRKQLRDKVGRDSWLMDWAHTGER